MPAYRVQKSEVLLVRAQNRQGVCYVKIIASADYYTESVQEMEELERRLQGEPAYKGATEQRDIVVAEQMKPTGGRAKQNVTDKTKAFRLYSVLHRCEECSLDR